jgi:hypothetical protein
VTRPHYHPLKREGVLASSVEHRDHPGPDRRHVHEGQPELGPSEWAEPFEAAMERMAKRAGRRLRPG